MQYVFDNTFNFLKVVCIFTASILQYTTSCDGYLRVSLLMTVLNKSSEVFFVSTSFNQLNRKFTKYTSVTVD